MKDKSHYLIRKQTHETAGKVAFSLDVFGDFLAEREQYKSVEGLDAVHFFLVHKFNWLPSQVKNMTTDDIRFILSEEMHEWAMPEEAAFVIK